MPKSWMLRWILILCLLLTLSPAVAQEVTEEPTVEVPVEPTVEPTLEPSPVPPTEAPTDTPEPTVEPTIEAPTDVPTEEPTVEVTEEPTAEITEEPTATVEPTEEATVTPLPTVDTAPAVPAPAAPNLRQPVDTSIISQVRPRLVWQRPTGAVRYRVDLARDALFSNSLLTNFEVVGTALNLAPTVLPNELTQGTYYWRVSAMDSANEWGDESAVWSFTVGLQRSPRINTFTTNARIPFTWARAREATRYRLLIDDNNDFSSPLVTFETTALRFVPPRTDPLPVANLFWRVDVELNGAWVESPVVFPLTVTPRPLRAPVPTAPANNNQTNNTSPDFAWTEVVDPSSQPVTYEFQLSTVGTFRTLTYTVTTADTGFTLPLVLTDARYFWRVRTLNYLGAPGPWSRRFSFIVDTVPPLPPVLTAPRDGSSFSQAVLVFRWRASQSAASYDIRWGTTNPPVGNGVNTARRTNYRHTDPLLTTTYYWQVRATDLAGNTSDWSAPFSFVAQSPSNAVPVLNRFTTGTPTLSWTPISWATGYQVVVAADSNFANIVYNRANIAPGSLNHTLESALPQGVYYWRVRARIDPNTWGVWSTTGTFLIQN